VDDDYVKLLEEKLACLESAEEARQKILAEKLEKRSTLSLAEKQVGGRTEAGSVEVVAEAAEVCARGTRFMNICLCDSSVRRSHLQC
jgi:hypothetical protein